MPFFLKFAAKNLGRHGRRTWITASALATGLAAFLFVDAMLQGLDGESERNLIWYEFGGARIASPEAAAQPEKLSLKHPVDDPRGVAALVRSRGTAAAPRLVFEAELVSLGTENPSGRVVRAVGIDGEEDGKVFPRRELVLEGRWPGPGEPAVVLGRWLAEDLAIALGQTVTLTTRTRSGSFQVIDLEVCGVVEAPDPVVNRGGVYLPLELAQDQLEMAGLVTEVAVAFAPGSDADAGAADLEQALKAAGQTVEVRSWRDLAGDFLALTAAKQKGSGMVLLLVFVIAAVGVGNTLMLAFYERKTEIGMLRALGMSDRRLFWTFLTEAAGIGAIGSALGLALGAFLVGLLVSLGIDFGWLIRDTDIGYRIAGVMHGVWSPRSFVGAAVVGVFLSILCAVGPTRRALRLPITESLRSE